MPIIWMLQEESYFRITSAPRLCSPLGEGESAVCIKDENVKGKSSSSAGAEKKTEDLRDTREREAKT